MNRFTLTNLLVAVNVLVYVAELATGGPEHGRVVRAGFLAPILVTQYGEWYRLVTSAFLHGSLTHIAFNMFALYQVGNALEPLLGRLRYAVLYAAALLGASFCVLLFSDPRVPTLGASGAIFGLFGALVAVGLQLPYGGMQLVRSVSGVIVLNLLLTFLVPGISWEAHVGGLVTGFIAGAALFALPSRRKAQLVQRMKRYAAAAATEEIIEQPPEAGPHEEIAAAPLEARDPSDRA